MCAYDAIAVLALIVLGGVESRRKRNRDSVSYGRGEQINDIGKAGIFPIRKFDGAQHGEIPRQSTVDVDANPGLQSRSLSRPNEDALKGTLHMLFGLPRNSIDTIDSNRLSIA